MKRKSYARQVIFVITLLTFFLYGTAAVAIQQMQLHLPPSGQTEDSHPSAQPAHQPSHRAQPAHQKVRRAGSVSLKGDLSVQQLTFSPAKPKVGDTVTVKVLIHNAGPLNFTNALVRFYMNGKQISRDRGTTFNLLAGKSTTIQTTFSALKPGKFTISASLFPKKGQVDKNSRNDSASRQIVLVMQDTTRNVALTGIAPRGSSHLATPVKKRKVLKIKAGKIYNIAVKVSRTPFNQHLRFDIYWANKGEVSPVLGFALKGNFPKYSKLAEILGLGTCYHNQGRLGHHYGVISEDLTTFMPSNSLYTVLIKARGKTIAESKPFQLPSCLFLRKPKTKLVSVGTSAKPLKVASLRTKRSEVSAEKPRTEKPTTKNLPSSTHGKAQPATRNPKSPGAFQPMRKPLARPETHSPKGGPGIAGRFGGKKGGAGGFGSASPLPDWVPGTSTGGDNLGGPSGRRRVGSKGDGIQGIDDQDGMPNFGKGPGHTYGDDSLPGGGSGTSGHGFGKNQYGEPIFGSLIIGGNSRGGGRRRRGSYMENEQYFDAFLYRYVSFFKDSNSNIIKTTHGKHRITLTVEQTDGWRTTYTFTPTKDGKTHVSWRASYHPPDYTFDPEIVTRSGKNKMPKPDDGEDGTINPKQNPQLIAVLTRHTPHKIKLRPDQELSDPAGARAAKSSEARGNAQGQASSAAATQAKAEAKWKFVGKKPGSEVTDPAETQGTGGHGTPKGYKEPQGFLVMDPAEPEAASIRAARAANRMSQTERASSSETFVVTSVTGSVQKLSRKNSQQGWVPLKSGDKLGQGDFIRVDNRSGGEVGFGSLRTALSLSFNKIHGGSDHDVYIVIKNIK